MAESNRLVDMVQDRIDEFLSAQEPRLMEISPDLLPYLRFSRSLLARGKRFRALFCYWGWQSIAELRFTGPTASEDGYNAEFSTVLSAASSLELFHAAALVHDDIIDNSDTRRGQPAAHRRYQALHARQDWRGNADAFGRSGALLLGDLLLGWSDEILDDGLRGLPGQSAAASARREFNRMRTEVTCGQYLDLLEEASWHTRPEAELLSRANTVITYKSAKYSVESPLTIGAAIGGATIGQLVALREFGFPLGIAYQLRDDLLGVFGDPRSTGKPSGDDLREGKRTVLIAEARRRLPANSVRLLDELLGDPELTEHQVQVLQASLRDSGAVDEIERAIAHNVKKATTALDESELGVTAREQLMHLAEAVSQRIA